MGVAVIADAAASLDGSIWVHSIAAASDPS